MNDFSILFSRILTIHDFYDLVIINSLLIETMYKCDSLDEVGNFFAEFLKGELRNGRRYYVTNNKESGKQSRTMKNVLKSKHSINFG